MLFIKHEFDWQDDEISDFLALDAFTKGLSLFATIPLIRKLFRHSPISSDKSLIQVNGFTTSFIHDFGCSDGALSYDNRIWYQLLLQAAARLLLNNEYYAREEAN